MELLKTDHLGKTYNTKLGLKQCVALRDVNFSIETGEFIAIMGPSGSGKTTLLNILATLDRPTEGKVMLQGKDITQIKDKELSRFRRKNLGFVFQDFNLLDTFSVKDNILLPLVLSNTPLDEMEAKLIPITADLGIASLLEKFPYEISGGEKQRTAVARAVITQPKLILADEPTGALDSRASQLLLEKFAEFNAGGQTILMVTHSANAASYANRVIFIKDGELYSQIYRGELSRKVFFDKIVASITVITEGGGDIA